MVMAIWKGYAGGDDYFSIAAQCFVNSKNIVDLAVPRHTATRFLVHCAKAT